MNGLRWLVSAALFLAVFVLLLIVIVVGGGVALQSASACDGEPGQPGFTQVVNAEAKSAGRPADGPSAAGQLLWEQVKGDAAAAGFTGPDLDIATALTQPESGRNPLARNPSGASGLWQILESAHPGLFARYDWHDPAQNAVMAYAVYAAAGRSFTPWVTYTSGAYLQYLPDAAVAAATATGATDAGCPPASGGSVTGPGGPFPAESCNVIPDPTTGRGCLTPRTANIATQLKAQGWSLACWDQHAWNPGSDHPLGGACDVFPGRGGVLPTPAQKAAGDALSAALQAGAGQTGLHYLIWYGQIWSVDRPGEGWRPYSGGGIYNRGDVTGGHYDHVHISVY